MKTKEELAEIKEAAQSRDETAQLSDNELLQVTGGTEPQTGGIVDTCMHILHQMGLHPPEDLVRSLIDEGGSKLRNWALQQSHGNRMAYLLPVF